MRNSAGRIQAIRANGKGLRMKVDQKCRNDSALSLLDQVPIECRRLSALNWS
ncbi:MAG: hypothetical protein ACI9R3_005156 [Verrucomicrobiales bacterium]|jgi:hypothetical protein